MDRQKKSLAPAALWFGDVLTLAILTLVGFGSHNELGAGPARMLATFVPLLCAWALVAGPAGLLDPGQAGSARQLWRPAWAMLLAGPLAAVGRGLWLNSPVAPVFALVLGGTGMLAMLAWRALYTRLAAALRPG